MNMIRLQWDDFAAVTARYDEVSFAATETASNPISVYSNCVSAEACVGVC